MELQDFKNNNILIYGGILIFVALLWYGLMGSNTDYFKGSLNLNDVSCSPEYSEVFAREEIDLSTSLYQSNVAFDDLKQEISSASEVQVRVYTDLQACEDQTVINCDILDFVPYENSEVLICQETYSENSNYLLSNTNNLDTFAFYMQPFNNNQFHWIDTVYVKNLNQSNLRGIDIRPYNMKIFVK